MADSGRHAPALTARAAGLVGCLHCGRVWPAGTPTCGICGSPLSSRYPNSLQNVWAWWLAGLMAYIPANLYPMMITGALSKRTPSTIFGGVVELIHYNDYFVASVVFIASILIPSSKFLAIAFVAISIRRPRRADGHLLHKIYEVVEFIGRWSMIDVFVVAILSALVHLGSVADIYPGIAAVCFGTSVICTMISALSLDPRLIWDAMEDQEP